MKNLTSFRTEINGVLYYLEGRDLLLPVRTNLYVNVVFAETSIHLDPLLLNKGG